MNQLYQEKSKQLCRLLCSGIIITQGSMFVYVKLKEFSIINVTGSTYLAFEVIFILLKFSGLLYN